MPVYLCQPGSAASEPWRHGIQVYASPFALDEAVANGDDKDLVEAPKSSSDIAKWDTNDGNNLTSQAQTTGNSNQQSSVTILPSGEVLESRTNPPGLPIRRVRHSEIVLVDDVCIAFDRYWLRLRWPGSKGGFAGYIALGRINEPQWIKRTDSKEQGTSQLSLFVVFFFNSFANYKVELSLSQYINFGILDDYSQQTNKKDNVIEEIRESLSNSPDDDTYVEVETSLTQGEEERIVSDEADHDDPARDEEPHDNASTPSSEPFESTSTLMCLRTGLPFPSSVAMKLMPVYDDGMSPPVVSAPLPSEPVFCRICREGLHDDADDEQPSPAMENEGEDSSRFNSRTSSSMNFGDESDAVEDSEPATLEPEITKGPAQPYPTYHPNPHAAENPILAPCECSGSMAFVHYLCVEQWRCRSRHPEANHGLNCETCGKPYALPPPSARPTGANAPQFDEDWLEAMPPHVMAALRQPHIWWQIGAAIVRRRWLRPIAPVIMSPVVALYCRARRLLKKKGVARRRWACSLCRRRARWKCVRCLRSYYCSRQCQNVSWHIVHKHVCYKPTRWAWSVVVYGFVTLLLFPGILRDPLMYDLGLGFIPTSFYAMAILGGGFAATLKKGVGLDLRGRIFELIVILLTLWLVLISWGLVGAFFGDSSRCRGVLGEHNHSMNETPPMFLRTLQALVLQPAMNWFLMWDRLALNSGRWIRKALCTGEQEGCFQHLHKANADFFFEEYNGGKCASDLSLVSSTFISACIVTSCSYFLKRRDRQRRAARRPGRGPRPHQD